jgi:glycosyltransferase involved in cell wall biosynthesis
MPPSLKNILKKMLRVLPVDFANFLDKLAKEILKGKMGDLPTVNLTREKISPEIIFLAEADYHIRNAAMVVRLLAKYNISCAIFESCAAERKLCETEIKDYADIKIIELSDFNTILDHVNQHALKIVVSYSFGSVKTRDLLQEISFRGIKTAGIVEGVWDYPGLILGINQLTPYRNCDYTFLAGLADTLYFEDRLEQSYLGGLASIRPLLNERVSFPAKPLAVINVNFSYGQAEFGRNIFVETAVKTCEKAKIDYVISQHPHDFSAIRRKYTVSQKSMYQLIDECSIFISRFANGIFEALALGKPVIYHNPHLEKAINFQDPMGAYQKTHDVDSLTEAIKYELGNIQKKVDFRQRAREFLQYHANIFSDNSPAENIAKGLLDILNRYYNADRQKYTDAIPPISQNNNIGPIKHSQILVDLYEKHKSKRIFPKVSLIIPVYNIAPPLLRGCLDSAVKQTFLPCDYEIVIVNDASTDGSLDIIREYEKKYSNIKVVNKPQNEGLGMARNSGLEVATGEYVFFLDGDDFISVMTLDRLYTEAKLNDADIVPCSHLKVSLEEGYKILSRRKDLVNIPHDKLARMKSIVLHKHYSVAWGNLIRRKLFIENHIAYPKGYHEDLIVCLKLFTYAKSIFIVDEPFYNYVQRPTGITGNINKAHIDGALTAQEEKWNFIHSYLGTETACRHFDRDQIIQRGLLIFSNVLLRSIHSKEPDIKKRIDLYRHLFNSIQRIDFMSNSPLLYNEKSFPLMAKLWKIFEEENESIDKRIMRFELLNFSPKINKLDLNYTSKTDFSMALALFRNGDYLEAMRLGQQLHNSMPDFKWYNQLVDSCLAKLKRHDN